MKKGKWKRKLIIVLLIFGILLAGIYYVFQHYYTSSNFVKDDEVAINYDYLKQLSTEESVSLDTDALTAGYEGEENDVPEIQSEYESELVVADVEKISEEQASGTYNILLIGVDRRNDDWYGNSDAMILATINHDVQKIFLTSFMRDLYADIPGFGVMKLNAAHAIGGGPLLVETIVENYGVKIDNYARVDFGSLAEIIDIVGGVDIDVSEEEASVANNYIDELCKLQSLDAADYYLTGGGMTHLNGIQAVAYSRIRYVGNYDYERTSRQREVLTDMLSNVKTLNLGQLNEMVNEILPLVTHNVEQGTMLNLISQFANLISYEIVTDRVPYDGLFYSRNELLVPDMEATVARLQETIYAKE